MEDGEVTEEGLSLEKTTPKWTGPEPTQLAGLLSLWSKLGCAGEHWFRCGREKKPLRSSQSSL